MPHMDGIETTKKLREGGHDGIIVALTANALLVEQMMIIKQLAGIMTILPPIMRLTG